MNLEQLNQLIEPYEAIIFDYGGILLNIDYNKTVDAFTEISPELNKDLFYNKKKQIEIFDLIETGKITPEDFLAQLAHILNHQDIESIKNAWCALLMDLPLKRIDFIKELKHKKRILMLSNINQIHEDHLKDYLNEINQSDFYNHFEKAYFSHHVNLRKPDAKIFELVIDENNLNPSKTLFIDDSPQHIEAAKEIGLSTFWLENANSLLVK